MQHPINRYQPIKEDINERTFNATFSADEILDLFKVVLDKNVTQKNTKLVVSQKLNSVLYHTAIDEKAKKIIQSLKKALDHSSNTETNAEIALVEEELNDLIAYIQLSAGFSPRIAEENNIQHNFMFAFNVLSSFLRVLRWQDLPANEKISSIRNTFQNLALRTLADIININIEYFDYHERLRNFLLTLLDYDTAGLIAGYFKPSIRTYYEHLVLLQFQSKPNIRLFAAAIRAAKSQNVDISASIEPLPNNRRKFNTLLSFCRDDPALNKQLKLCAQRAIDPEVIRMAIEHFPDDEALKENAANMLAAALSDWLNSFMRSKRPTEDEDVKKRHTNFNNFASNIGLTDREKRQVLLNAQDTDISAALRGMAERRVFNIQSMDPMVIDIREILSGGMQ